MSEDYQRLDQWLYYARVAKTRPLCAAIVSKGRIRINRQPTSKPHAKLHVGDILTFPAVSGGEVRVWRVLDLGERRGPAKEAALLYEAITEDG
ncbi:RNA-binding S4 domain-containing protein [Gluconobacter oxydans]|uniref:Heat shock protein n=4 Tax=Gluconobacter oxydans TaxID=442 RepID=Q5FPP2_GLUOX|nr:S4 domain-containing protein [Gluconobacter oxydans]AAW61654.1 Heat shock protein [Gluconobacter oxydans 621H]AHK71907.1 heat shock protein Hsp15 [Gluconobacter oxydans DSM 3504]KXV07077.1 heat-shock protein [Gluconobacter oxydans]KXV11910.1 heat-shock protein [Gluconobacter oxydans]KXV17833.1 heat-shock protein [Gluconobacter oxydans]